MESLGAADGALADSFAAFVFSSLRQQGRLGELLELPKEFDEPLAAWIEAQVPITKPSNPIAMLKSHKAICKIHLSEAPEAVLTCSACAR